MPPFLIPLLAAIAGAILGSAGSLIFVWRKQNQEHKFSLAARERKRLENEAPTEDKKWFDRFGNISLPWSMYGDQLLASARLIWKEYNRITEKEKNGEPLTIEDTCSEDAIVVAFLLYGYAVENYLKAIFLKRGHKLFQNGEMIIKHGFQNHRLDLMAQQLKFPLSVKETKTLNDLSTKVTSTSRYPTEIKSTPGINNRKFDLNDLTVIEVFIAKLHAELRVNPGQHLLKPA